MKKTFAFLLIFTLLMGMSACKREKSGAAEPANEDTEAKRLLQGIWVDEDQQDVVFKAQGDTIFYPDSTSLPVYFQIFKDTLVLHGANDVKYQIIKQTRNLFIFRNQNGDDVKCVLSTDPDDASFFSKKRPQALSINQGKLIKRDTVVTYADERYHCYVQVNPTSYKVVSQSYSDEGVAVDNVYYDNIINLNVYQGARKLFGSDFRKQQFAGKVPEEFLQQGILSDLTLRTCDGKGIHYVASFIIPGAGMSTYQVEVVVSYQGKLSMKAAS